jgi:hypothetical protein
MFDVCKPKLSFAEISEYWGAEINLSKDRVQARLEEAWWLGEISGDSSITRLELLKSMFKRMRSCDAPHIVFIAPEDTSPAKTNELDDGSLLIDLRPRVPVPSGNPNMWSEESCRPAFEALADKPSLKYYAGYSPGFMARKLTCDEYFAWIAAREFRYPEFWRRTKHKATSLKVQQASDRMITDEVSRAYNIADKESQKPPNIKELVKVVKAALREKSHKASGAQIEEVGNRSEFAGRRRLAGKTLKSERRHPRE